MEQEVMAYLKAFLHQYKESGTQELFDDGCILLGCIRMFEATGDVAFREFILDFLKRRSAENGPVRVVGGAQFRPEDCLFANAFFFALHETGSAAFQKAVEECRNQLAASAECREMRLEHLFMVMPFYMAYEKEMDKYGHLSDITSQFQQARASLFDESRGLYARGIHEEDAPSGCVPGSDFSSSAIGLFFTALVDCIELCDEQLYEHYRYLIDLLREGLKGILPYLDAKTHLFFRDTDRPGEAGNEPDAIGSALIAYAALKGVRLGVLNPSWQKYGLTIFEGCLKHAFGASVAEPCRAEEGKNVPGDPLKNQECTDHGKGAGAVLMAFAEYQMAGR